MSINTDCTEPAWANLKGEIARKVSEVMDRYTTKHVDGEITERELRIALDAVFDCVQGLCPRDVEALLYETTRELAS